MNLYITRQGICTDKPRLAFALAVAHGMSVTVAMPDRKTVMPPLIRTPAQPVDARAL